MSKFWPVGKGEGHEKGLLSPFKDMFSEVTLTAILMIIAAKKAGKCTRLGQVLGKSLGFCLEEVENRHWRTIILFKQ